MNRPQRDLIAAFLAEHAPLAFAMLEAAEPNILQWLAEKFAVVLPQLIELGEFDERFAPPDCLLLSGAALKGVLSAVPGPEYIEACSYIRNEDLHPVSICLLLDWLRAPNNSSSLGPTPP